MGWWGEGGIERGGGGGRDWDGGHSKIRYANSASDKNGYRLECRTFSHAHERTVPRNEIYVLGLSLLWHRFLLGGDLK